MAIDFKRKGEAVLKMKPLGILLTMLVGWVNSQQTEIIEYLLEEDKILREMLGGKRLLLKDHFLS